VAPGQAQGAPQGGPQGARPRRAGDLARRLVGLAGEVRFERVGAAAVLTIDRPARRNAIDGAAAEALREGFERFEGDDEARVLVLTGAGGESFCAGADLKALDTLAPRMGDPGGPLGFTRRAASKPTIAAVGGWCLAGGLELALWCDLRIASDTATFGLPERRWGVPLVDGGTQRLPRVVGLGRALDLVLTGRLIGAAEAHAIGLVTEIVAPGRHLERALEVAEGLARFPQRTLLADRRATHAALGLELAEGLELEAGGAADTLADAAAGAARFAAGEGRGGAGAGV
jgi:enoyl-CoA hydratase